MNAKEKKKSIGKENDIEDPIQEKIEVKNDKINKQIHKIRAERFRLEDKNYLTVHNEKEFNTEYEKLKHENAIYKSDIIMFKDEVNLLNEINRKLEHDLNNQRTRK